MSGCPNKMVSFKLPKKAKKSKIEQKISANIEQLQKSYEQIEQDESLFKSILKELQESDSPRDILKKRIDDLVINFIISINIENNFY